jgi:hypothetical protein
MFKTDMRLYYIIPVIFVSITVVFAVINFDIIDVATIIFSSWLLLYFILGYIKRKDALTIENDIMRITSPFKTKEYNIYNIKRVYCTQANGRMLKAVYEENGERSTITLCNNLYKVKIEEIRDYLIEHYPHLASDFEDII